MDEKPNLPMRLAAATQRVQKAGGMTKEIVDQLMSITFFATVAHGLELQLLHAAPDGSLEHPESPWSHVCEAAAKMTEAACEAAEAIADNHVLQQGGS